MFMANWPCCLVVFGEALYSKKPKAISTEEGAERSRPPKGHPPIPPGSLAQARQTHAGPPAGRAVPKLGKGSKPRSRLAHHPRPSPISRIACSNGHALTGNGQLHMPEPQLQLLRSDNTSTCPGGRVGCRERYALRPVKTRSREVKRERAIARVRCSAESARAPFYKEAPTVPAPARAPFYKASPFN